MNKLHMSPDALEDLAEIKAYIADELQNTQVAIATVGKITKTIRMLQDYALIGAPLSSIANVSDDYRYLTSGSYMIFYRVFEKDIYVDRVLYGRRDYLRILNATTKDDQAE